MAEEQNPQEGASSVNYNFGVYGLNMDQSISQVKKGQLTYALNAALENFDANSVNYQNEQGNEFCVQFPSGYVYIGGRFIQERNKQLFMLCNPSTGDSEIGYMDNNDCTYHTLINAVCLNFNVNHPIHKIVHKINSDGHVEIYWTDAYNVRRYMNIDSLPYKLKENTDLCNPEYTTELDCNKIKLQPDFSIPDLKVSDVISGGDNIAGSYQFTIQYSDASGNPFTSYYSVTNPTPIADLNIVTQNFNYRVAKSIVLEISNLDVTGQFQYFNLAVIRTVNNIPSVELVGTYFIDSDYKKITYSGQNVEQIKLSILDIFEKHPYYDVAGDLTAVQDVLVWDQLSIVDRINYQSIANKISTKWQTYRIPETETYATEFNATNLRGYLRDEIYAFEIVFLLRNGKQTDSFHIPGRAITNRDNPNFPILPNNPDYIGDGKTPTPYWKVYNTATVIGPAQGEIIGNATPHQYGEMAYWESEELYPCNQELWGELSGTPIRHHKFPDVSICPLFESTDYNSSSDLNMGRRAIYSLGLQIDVNEILALISSSNLTDQQKYDIVGFKIVRGDRSVNKSIVGKGVLRNISKYERDEQTYYFPNYPYNDLNDDCFLNSVNNAFSRDAKTWLVIGITNGTSGFIEYDVTDINTGKITTKKDLISGQTIEICSATRPYIKNGVASVGPAEYDVYYVSGCKGAQGYDVTWNDPFSETNMEYTPRTAYVDGWARGCDSVYCRVAVGDYPNSQCSGSVGDWIGIGCETSIDKMFIFTQPLNKVYATSKNTFFNPITMNPLFYVTYGRRTTLNCISDKPLLMNYEDLKNRQIFNSPETSFGQPTLGNVLKLESVIFGKGVGHFVEVKNNAKYKLISREAQSDALASSFNIASLTDPFNPSAAILTYQMYLQLFISNISRKNFAYSYNSIADYNYSEPVPNDKGIKQRQLLLKQYLIPTVQSVGDEKSINNYKRETSVFLKANHSINYPHELDALKNKNIVEHSRITIGDSFNCNAPGKEVDLSVVSYYASIKNNFPNQWGQIYSYETIDTGFQYLIDKTTPGIKTIFGGDTFIGKFAYKTKLPFFIDNRVGAPDDSDIFYDEIGNIAYPKFWHSARSIVSDYVDPRLTLRNFFSYKAHNFDCYTDPATILSGTARTFYDGYFYLFAYGIPSFYCESSYNLDLRQAFNQKEGEFWPHVSTGIPDDWLQESFVSISNDNTYHYNVSYSKQNKENTFTHLPPDWTKERYTNYEFRAIYSEPQVNNADVRVNNWLLYKPLSLFDFPKNYGKLLSLDGIQNRAILARFENKSLLYNNLLTIDTSNPQAAYIGNPKLFAGAPPIDFAETDLGYVGSQNKFLLKIPNGQVTIDAKRGQIFLIQGTSIKDLSAFGSGLNRFLTDHLSFEILRWFPDVPTDNHFNGIGIHGVYDSKFDRIIITKLDYVPLDESIRYNKETNEFYIVSKYDDVEIETPISLADSDFFCNKSWTISMNMNTMTWVSFHSYIPNFYIGENNFFYSGINGCCSDDDGSFMVMVGDTNKVFTTTTTTTIPVTTTTTTHAIISCDLEGEAFYTNCELEGTAVVTVYPVPTTTLCKRPMLLNRISFIKSYTIDGVETIFNGSFDEACQALELLKRLDPETVSVKKVKGEYEKLDLMHPIYLVDEYSPSDDCTVIEDGYYFTDKSIGYTGEIYHIKGGSLAETIICDCSPLTTTTTTMPNINECCGVIFSKTGGYLYSSDGYNLNLLNVPGFSNTFGVAISKYKLWGAIDGSLKEWDITLSPFTATFNRTINFPIGLTSVSGMFALDDSKLLLTNETTGEPISIGIFNVDEDFGTSYNELFTLPSGYKFVSSPIVSDSNKIISCVKNTVDKTYFIKQFIFDGTEEFSVDLSFEPLGIFICECNIFVVDKLVQVYTIDSDYNLQQTYTLSQSDLIGMSQLSGCIYRDLIDVDFTTTTTTTII